MVCYNPQERISARNALYHPFLSEIAQLFETRPPTPINTMLASMQDLDISSPIASPDSRQEVPESLFKYFGFQISQSQEILESPVDFSQEFQRIESRHLNSRLGVQRRAPQSSLDSAFTRPHLSRIVTLRQETKEEKEQDPRDNEPVIEEIQDNPCEDDDDKSMLNDSSQASLKSMESILFD